MTKNATRLLILTFTGIFIEITFCVWGFAQLQTLWVIPFMLGLYHGGYLLVRISFLFRHDVTNQVVLVTSIIAIAFGTYIDAWPLIAISILIFSTWLQAYRRYLKTKVKLRSFYKNLSKSLAMCSGVVGVLSVPSLSIIMLFIAGIVTLIIFDIHSIPTTEKHWNVNLPIQRNLLWFEFFHHAHYFAYCYTFWALLGRQFVPFIGPLFIIGWIAYFVLEWFLRENSLLFNRRVLILGHTICALALAGMLVFESNLIILVLWFITGLGGGTAYMLGNIQNGGNRELYEDLGHVAGCFGSALLLLVVEQAEVSILLGIIYAISAVLLLIPKTKLIDLQQKLT